METKMSAVLNLERAAPANLATAFANAQKEIANPKFDSTNPHFKSKFASLAAVRNAIIPVFAKHGLSVIQDLQTTERGISCLTILLHSSGERLDVGPLVMPAMKPDAMSYGSAATYARRYSLLALAGVAGEDPESEDDGVIASAPQDALSAEQISRITELLAETKADKGKFLKWLQASSIASIRARDYDEAVKALEKKIQ
jgi:hypothetical protein